MSPATIASPRSTTTVIRRVWVSVMSAVAATFPPADVAASDRALEDRLPESARDELDREGRGAVALIKDRVDLGDLDGPQLPRRGEHLHRELRLAVCEAATHRRPDPWRFVRIERVHIERQVDAVALAGDRDRLLHRWSHSHAIDVRHRQRGDPRPLDVVALARVDIAEPQKHTAITARGAA